MSIRSSRALTYGTFDMFHYGHYRLIERIRGLSDQLFVGVSTDEFNLQKNKRAVVPFRDRIGVLQNIRLVDGVFPEHGWDQKKTDIIRLKIDLLVMGSDWEGHFDHLSPLCRMVYLPRTPWIDSTKLRSLWSLTQGQDTSGARTSRTAF